MPDLTGQVIGNYRVEHSLGAGGMGVVYRARHLHLGREAAIKVMHAHLAVEPGFRARFRREARAAASLNHPYIIQTYEFGEQNGQLYLIMELVPDGSIRALFPAAQGNDDVFIAGLALAQQAAQGLEHAHAQGIVHRDIKPDNLLLKREDSGFSVRISDFGLAQLAEDTILTDTGLMMGTPAYMSPEYCQGHEADFRSDQYALGAVLYELTTGRLPFETKTLVDAAYQHVHVPPVPPSTYRPDVQPELEAIILRCLAKSPDDRYANTADLVAALHEISPSVVGPVSIPGFDVADTVPESQVAAVQSGTAPSTTPDPTLAYGATPDWHEETTIAETPDGFRVHDAEAVAASVAGQRRRSKRLFGIAAMLVLTLLGIGVFARVFDDGGGADAETGAPTATPVDTPAETATSQSGALIGDSTETPAVSATLSATLTPTPTMESSSTLESTPTAIPNPIVEPSSTPTPTSTPTMEPSSTPTPIPAPTPTAPPSQPDPPALEPPNMTGIIVFSSDRHDDVDGADIYTIDVEETDLQRLTNHSGWDGSPRWSPDGTRIAFVSEQAGNREIYVMNADGTGQARLTFHPAWESDPSWSPDSKSIVFTSWRDGDAEIFVMNADGTNQRQLTHNAGAEGMPEFSPDGSRIAFSSDRDGDREIWVMNADGSDPRALTVNTAFDDAPRWSPDGQQIVFHSERDGNSEIYLMNSDGSDQQNISNHSAPDDLPGWSPDGRYLVFDSHRDGNWEMYVLEFGTSALKNLTNHVAFDGTPDWTT